MDAEKDTKIFISHIFDKDNECFNKNYPCATEFLDMQKQSLVQGIKKDFRSDFFLWGGYDDAERKILVFVPKYDVEKSEFLRVIRAEHNSAKPLSHRDYLGTLMGLGIKREFVGDILVFDGSADIIIKPELEEFVYSHLSKAAGAQLTVTSRSITELRVPVSEVKEITFSVSSMRVDSVLAEVFNLSRSKANEAVNGQLVYVNDVLCLKPDKTVGTGDKITLRHKGKVVISDIGNKSRKGRTFVSALRY
ncbi:MAG: hypothetical protein IJT38_03535 [Clostridia bacterium]|nr:hypothetical protein [Clostridia bacterium]